MPGPVYDEGYLEVDVPARSGSDYPGLDADREVCLRSFEGQSRSPGGALDDLAHPHGLHPDGRGRVDLCEPALWYQGKKDVPDPQCLGAVP